MKEIEIKGRKANISKLLTYGFVKEDDGYAYSCFLADGQLKMNVILLNEGLFAKLIDEEGEEYTLHLIKGTSGSFVGMVKYEYESKIEDILKNCFDTEIFKSTQAKEIIKYVENKYGDDLEFLWQKFPDNAVVRRKDNKKWYLALLTVSKRKLGINSDEKIEIIDLRMKSEEIENVVDNKKYFLGYHMNKKHWITILLDSSLPTEEILSRIDESFNLALK